MIYLTTTNKGKVREIGGMLLPLGIEVIPPKISNVSPETGDTYLENAVQKAAFYRKHNKLDGLILAEDSGLEIEELNGAPGVLSARFADNDQLANELVLEKLKGKINRNATFRTTFVLLENDTVIWKAENCIDVTISTTIRGSHGFGYDPILLSQHSFNYTWAEIDPIRKSLINPRRKIISELGIFLSERYL